MPRTLSANLERVLKAWAEGKPHGKRPDVEAAHERAIQLRYGSVFGISKPCWTDGQTVYSYAMPILWWDGIEPQVAPEELALRPDGGGRGGISMTTRRHIRGVREFLRKNPPDLMIKVAQAKLRLDDERRKKRCA